MKVYIVMEYAVIEYEDCCRVMGVFSSVDKAAEAMAEYEKDTEDSRWRHEYFSEEYELDNLWQASCWITETDDDEDGEDEEWEQ